MSCVMCDWDVVQLRQAVGVLVVSYSVHSSLLFMLKFQSKCICLNNLLRYCIEKFIIPHAHSDNIYTNYTENSRKSLNIFEPDWYNIA